MQPTPRVEESHFLAQQRMAVLGSYYDWILDHFRPVMGARIWDVGAGIGNVASRLSREADFLLVTEYTERNLAHLRDLFKDTPSVQVMFCDLMADDLEVLEHLAIDTIVIFDVLEHLEDDSKALRALYRVLTPGGRVLVKVPAHRLLYGSIDRASLHYRRYAKGELQQKLIQASFQVESVQHMNMLGVLPYFVTCRILQRTSNFSLSLHPRWAPLCNRLIPVIAGMERILPPVFGLSLVATARKPGKEGTGPAT